MQRETKNARIEDPNESCHEDRNTSAVFVQSERTAIILIVGIQLYNNIRAGFPSYRESSSVESESAHNTQITLE